jgi:hypothetical protein
MRQYIVCFGLMTLLVVASGIVAAQPTSLEPRRDLHGEWTLWQLADDQWYFRLTVGALANVYPKLLQPTGFARLTLGLSWAPNWLITPQIQITKAVHEITLSLEGVGNEPTWVIEFTPFVIDFEINPYPNQARAVSSTPASQQPTAQPAQQVSLDLKALVLSRLEDLLKASEQMAKDRSIDLATLTDPLKEFKKLFEANKIVDASLQLNAYSFLLRVLRKMGGMSEYDEAHLRTGLFRLMTIVALFGERTQPPAPVPLKLCTGLYVREDQKAEEVLSPFIIEALKKLTFTNTKTGAKETFNLKESKCF